MKISVAMAVYNGMQYIEKQLDSIRLQFLLPDEVVICDDSSADGTADFIEQYIEKHSLFGWTLYRNEQNLGFKKNFLSALSKTDGDIIFLCDQDDIWHNEKTLKMSQIMEQNPNILSLSSSFEFIDENDNTIAEECSKNTSNHGLIGKKIHKGAISNISFKTVMHSNFSPGCTTVIRKELKESFCQNSNSVLPHDWELNLVAALNNGLYFYNEVMSDYRIHSSNTLGLHSAAKERIAVAEEKCAAANSLCLYGNFEKLLNMQKKRVDFLKNKKFFGAIKLFFTCREYMGCYSFKERIGDILFTLK